MVEVCGFDKTELLEDRFDVDGVRSGLMRCLPVRGARVGGKE